MGELEALLRAVQHSGKVFQGERLSSGSRPGAGRRTVSPLRVVAPWGSRHKAPRGARLRGSLCACTRAARPSLCVPISSYKDTGCPGLGPHPNGLILT